MPCYHPLKGFILGTGLSGKKDLKVVSNDVKFLWIKPDGKIEKMYYDDSKSFDSYGDRIIKDSIPIPCGQCLGCRLEYSRQWAIRCMLESEYHESNYFITLTYDEENVIHTGYYDDDGYFSDTLTLYKKDLQDFIKRLRSDLSYHGFDSFRYYACGEYGSRSARPHYHVLAFGLELNDLFPSTRFDGYYESEYLTDKWGKGNVIVGSVTFESCAYVSRYIMKKKKGKQSDFYTQFNISPEFTVMSRRPGIGKDYFLDNYSEIYPSDKLVLSGGRLTRPPRYFDNLMDSIDEKLMEDVKLKRVDIAERLQALKSMNTSESVEEQLLSAERNKEAQIKKLVRILD